MGIKEDVYFEGGPHVGELIFGLLLGLTVICLPITAGAVVRALWLRYRITSRRITITGGWMGRDRTDVVYSQVAKVVSVSRGIGLWGDMVVTLKDGSKLELKAVPKFRDVAAYIEEKAGIGTPMAAAA
ncbi:PH domain-containing protein [Altericista sp. CCNU0014]|uniref:PH domain-containing protein n=1 Tax=Altericista sp. CCNU0014 TaxID=3082949 RepID=UPI00384CD8F9